MALPWTSRSHALLAVLQQLHSVHKVGSAQCASGACTWIALHLHDTWGRGLANCLAGLEAGIAIFDTSAGGLGGCPYAPGATGNLATEDLVGLLDRLGVESGVDVEKVADASLALGTATGLPLPSRALAAMSAQRARS